MNILISLGFIAHHVTVWTNLTLGRLWTTVTVNFELSLTLGEPAVSDPVRSELLTDGGNIFRLLLYPCSIYVACC